MSTMAPVLPGMKTGWPRGTAPISNDSKEVKTPSLTLNRQVNLYPLTNYTFGTKGNPTLKLLFDNQVNSHFAVIQRRFSFPLPPIREYSNFSVE